MNQLEKTVFEMLADRQRINNKTNLDQFFVYLRNRVPNASDSDLMSVFKSLEELGYGSIVYGRGNNPTRFLWNYNLSDVARKELGEDVEIRPFTKRAPIKKKKVFTRKIAKKIKPIKFSKKQETAKPTAQVDSTIPVVSINLQLGKDISPKDIQALIELANSLKSK